RDEGAIDSSGAQRRDRDVVGSGRVVERLEWTRGGNTEDDVRLESAGAVVQVYGIAASAQTNPRPAVIADLKTGRRVGAEPERPECRGVPRSGMCAAGLDEDHRLAWSDAGDAIQRHCGAEGVGVVVHLPARNIRSDGSDVRHLEPVVADAAVAA